MELSVSDRLLLVDVAFKIYIALDIVCPPKTGKKHVEFLTILAKVCIVI